MTRLIFLLSCLLALACTNDHVGVTAEEDLIDATHGDASADVPQDSEQTDSEASDSEAPDSTSSGDVGGELPTFTCGSATCVVGEGCCSDSCVDLETDKQHCGSCNTVCPGSQLCESGACVAGPTCPAGQGECDGDVSTSCETDLMTTPTHCGACGSVCRAGEVCTGGQCTAGTCLTGTADCDGNPNNGCETLTGSDANNCGQCNVVCPQGNPCQLGFCSCGTGQALCSGVCVNLTEDANNCGRCGAVCASGQVCRFGSCQPQGSNCTLPRADCDGDPATVCEVDVSNDPLNCGTCGTICGTGEECSFGFCRDTDCSFGRGDCDGDASNGCETDVGSDPQNCGRCGVMCGAAQSCNFGFCF